MNVTYKQQDLITWVNQYAHNWLIHNAFQWLKNHSPNLLPEGLEERHVHYGAYFADYPWIGREETISTNHPNGLPLAGVCDDLAGDTVGSDCVGIGNDYCVEIRYWKKVNLYLSGRWTGSYFVGAVRESKPLDQIGHYPHTSHLRLDGTSGREDRAVSGATDSEHWNVKGDVYATQLFELSRSFWPGLDPAPDINSLLRVMPGHIIIRHLISGAKASVKAPEMYLGSNPYIACHAPTWPIWVPDSYSTQKLNHKKPPRSHRAASIYLGWALHLLQDLVTPFHAVNRFGNFHTDGEDELDAWIRQGLYNHLPVTNMPSMGGGTAYRYIQRSAYWPNFFDELARPNYCRRYSLDAYGGYSVNHGELLERFREVVRLAAPYYDDVHPDLRQSKDQSIAAWEIILDMALKNTILMIATVNRNAGFSGKVLSQTGTPLARARMTFTIEDNSVSKSVQANDGGEFLVNLPKLGNYSVSISHPDEPVYSQRWYVLRRGGFRPLTIQVGDNTPPNGVRGTAWLVVSRTRRVPLQNAQVELLADNFTASTKTNIAGRFTLGMPHPGKATVSITHPQVKSLVFKITVIEGYLDTQDWLLSKVRETVSETPGSGEIP